MSKTSAIIDDFSKGEVSPIAMARLSSAQVRDGLYYCENLIPDPRGPVISRQGMRHIDEIECVVKDVSIHEFEMYEGKSICIVLHDNKMTLYNASTETFMQTIDTPYDDGKNVDVRLFPAPDSEFIYFLHKEVEPYILTIKDLDPVQENLIDLSFDAATITAMPEEWVDDNFPTCMTFFQDRAWFAGTFRNPEGIWATKTGDYDNMTLGTTGDDAMYFVLQDHGLVKWLAGHKNLLIGTAFGEYIATGSDGVIMPGDVQITIQSAFGSKSIIPEFIGDEVLYVSPDGRKIRAMNYRWLEQGWKSEEITFWFNHLTQGSITDISYVRDPYSTIYILTGENQIVSCSYLRTGDSMIVGAGRITPPDLLSEVVAMTTINDRGVSSLWVASKIEIEGEVKIHLMKQDNKDIFSEDLIMLDDYVEKVPVDKVISGLDYLEGTEVDMVGDGAVLPTQVVSGGMVTLDNDFDVVYVGHSFTQKMTTLPFIIYGSSQLGHQMKHWNKMYVSLLNSFPPLINGNRPATRHVSTPMGDGEPAYTGLVNVSGVGWDRQGRITIEQDIPRALMVLGIYGEVALEDV